MLTAARRCPPVVHHGPLLFAGGCISLQRLAEDAFRPVAHAHVVEAVAEEIPGFDHLVASLEGPLEAFFDQATVLVATVQLLLLLLAHGAVAFTEIPAKRVVVGDFPAFGPSHDGGDKVVALLGDVVLWLEVEIAAEAAGVLVVAAGELDQQVPVPVVRHPEAEIGLQHGGEPALGELHPAVLQAHREQGQHPVHLGVRCIPIIFSAIILHPCVITFVGLCLTPFTHTSCYREPPGGVPPALGFLAHFLASPGGRKPPHVAPCEAGHSPRTPTFRNFTFLA